MSWGERSCKGDCRCPDKCSMGTCNVSCSGYIWDGVTTPGSGPNRKKSELEAKKLPPTSKGFHFVRGKKKYKNYLENQRLRKKNPNIRRIVDGKPVSYRENFERPVGAF